GVGEAPRPLPRSRAPMEPEEKKISVWICQEEKLISGLTKRTTCSDVQQQLQLQQASLQECGGGMLSGLPQSYCIVEKWRGFERILPNKTKILRLWAAWGDEQENVRFVLVRSEASLPNTGPRSAEARVVPSRDSPGRHGLGVTARASLTLSQERQRRVVRKAFRKLAKINKRKGMETLVHLVLSQDHTIRQQIKRLRDLDREIDRHEARIHFDRMKRHGVNYVQDTYLVGEEPEPPAGEQELKSPAGAAPTAAAAGELEKPAEELIEHLAGEIQEELNERWMRRRRDELAAAKGSSASLSETDCNTTELSGGGELHVEQERVKTQLSTSLYIGLRLNTDLDAVKSDLEFTQRAWEEETVVADEDERRDLPFNPGGELPSSVPITSGDWGEEAARSLSKDREDREDEDSDTGLSSMHSQDSDSVPVCESLV
uniref:Ras association domain family member 10 n=1 Tax=Naja naja TaxID=35670 RepID=A0A8C6XXP1_NAJNA